MSSGFSPILLIAAIAALVVVGAIIAVLVTRSRKDPD